MTQALAFAERVRRALLALSNRPDSVFSGRYGGRRRRDGHRHAFILPEDLTGPRGLPDGRIDHVTIFGREELRGTDRTALESLRTLFSTRADFECHLVQEWLGPLAAPPHGLSGALARARAWVSATPYCLERHPKRNGRESARAQLLRDLERAHLPRPEVLEEVGPPEGVPHGRGWKGFRLDRPGRKRPVRLPGGAEARGFLLVFPVPVRGPLAFGYARHFGLGRFRPLDGGPFALPAAPASLPRGNEGR